MHTPSIPSLYPMWVLCTKITAETRQVEGVVITFVHKKTCLQCSPVLTAYAVFSQSAIFNFQSLLTVVLLMICTCTFIHAIFPSILDRNKTG